MNRRVLALGLLVGACTPGLRGERFQGALRLGVDEALFWPRGRDDGPWQVAAATPVMAAIQAAVKAANGGFAYGGIDADVLARLGAAAAPAPNQTPPRRLTVLKLLRSAPESFTVRG